MKVHEITLYRTEDGWRVHAVCQEKLVGVSVCAEIGGEDVAVDWYKPFVLDSPLCDDDEVLLMVKNLVQQ